MSPQLSSGWPPPSIRSRCIPPLGLGAIFVVACGLEGDQVSLFSPAGGPQAPCRCARCVARSGRWPPPGSWADGAKFLLQLTYRAVASSLRPDRRSRPGSPSIVKSAARKAVVLWSGGRRDAPEPGTSRSNCSGSAARDQRVDQVPYWVRLVSWYSSTSTCAKRPCQ